MPRSTPSEADQRLIADAAQHGVVVTARQLERWRAAGLLAPNVRRPLGRGRGSKSELPPDAAQLVIWLARNARRGRRPGDLALLAFAAELAVPEDTVRAAFADAVTRVRLPVESSMSPGAAPEDVAAAAVAAGLGSTLVPARIRRIDHNLARRGVNWSSPELAALDPGRSDSRLTNSDWVYNAVQLVLSGGEGIDMGTIGAFARTLSPAGGVAPLAGQIEYRWPMSRGEEPNGLPDDDDVLGSLLGGGDLRDQIRGLAMSTPAAELREAFRLAVQLPGWADSTCAAVEQEIATGQLGEAAKEWIMSAMGVLTRLLLATGLRDQKAGPASIAVTALGLIFERNKVRILRKFVSAESFDVLNNLAPTFLIEFLNR